MNRMRKNTIGTIAVLGALVFTAFIMMAWANPPTGVTPTPISRGTFEAFNVRSDSFEFKFKASAKPRIDLVIRSNDFAPGGSSGWHTHPGPVFITVQEGQLTFYELDDPDCKGTLVTAGRGYVDTGRGHIARNEGVLPAKDVAVVVAPMGGAFRDELPENANPACVGF
jgi:hypothetical protein